jgi:hypothetical protein
MMTGMDFRKCVAHQPDIGRVVINQQYFPPGFIQIC